MTADEANRLTALGDSYRQQTLFNEAMHAYEDALVTEPEHVPALQGIAEVFAAKHWYHCALVVLEDAATLAPNNAEIQKRVAQFVTQLEQTAQAARA